LVKYLAGRLAVRVPACLGQEDLESCGILGLIEAVEKYDPSQGTSFTGYAYHRIRGAMLDEIRRLNWVPRGTWHKLQRVAESRQRLEHEYNGGAVPEEVLAAEAGLTTAELQRIRRQTAQGAVISLDEAAVGAEGEAFSWGEVLPDPGSPDPLAAVEEAEARRLLATAVRELPERDRLVLALYYQEGLTLKEIGRVLDVSESRVCQLHGRAIARLREKLGGMLFVGRDAR
ncbi:MAG: FliA/WhiG family RNA polymerase sigma factor, partial [Firmicutes bacterium]|nr:FliA/WhiG family RNA polymerase sigma factor [Bacillota bacterium]